MRRNLLRAAVITAVGGGAVAAMAPSALAYDRTAAKNYANAFALTPNHEWEVYGNDCTNFVSQAMWAGGHDFHYGSNGWHADTTAPLYEGLTQSWYNADKLRQFLDAHNAGTYSQGPGSQDKMPYTPDAIGEGDVIFYNWDNAINPQPFDHTAIEVYEGTDENSGWIGSLVDAHTNNRQKAIWHLIPYNSQWHTTDTKEYRIPDGA